MLADLFEDDDDVLTVVRAPLGVRHASGVIPLVDDLDEAIVEEAPPSTVRTERLHDETSHVRPVASEEDHEHEPIGANAFESGTVVMDFVAPTPIEKLGKQTLQVTRDEIFGNSVPVTWDETPEPTPENPAAPEAAPRAAPSSPPTATELFVDEVSQGSLTPLPIPTAALEPTIAELSTPTSPPPPVIGPSLVPSSGRNRQREVDLRARVAAGICLLLTIAAAVAWRVWL